MNPTTWKNYFIELLIVIIGISIAFYLNNLAEVKKEDRLEAKYIADIRADLVKDSSNLSFSIKFSDQKIQRLERLLSLLMSDDQRIYKDSLMSQVGIIGNYVFFHSESFTLHSLLQSGDIKLIESETLKKELLRLRWMFDIVERDQNNFLQALDNNYYPMVMTKSDIIENKMIDEDFYYGVSFKNWVAYTYNDTNNMRNGYASSLKQVRKIISIIDESSN